MWPPCRGSGLCGRGRDAGRRPGPEDDGGLLERQRADASEQRRHTGEVEIAAVARRHAEVHEQEGGVQEQEGQDSWQYDAADSLEVAQRSDEMLGGHVSDDRRVAKRRDLSPGCVSTADNVSYVKSRALDGRAGAASSCSACRAVAEVTGAVALQFAAL